MCALSGIANVVKAQKITDGIRIIIEVKIGPMNNKIKLLKYKILTKVRLQHKATISLTIRPQASRRAPRIETKETN